jgi:hypothetical protein
MPSLVDENSKLVYASLMNDIHDTFARPVIVWKTPERTIISSDISYNFLYNEQDSVSVSYQPVSGIFDCRIKWGDASELGGIPEIKEEIRGNFCRVKVKKEMLDFISDAERIEIDGRVVQQVGTSRPIGLFDIYFYIIYFKESE